MERYRSIWRFDPITGYWKHVREMPPELEKQWLSIFQRDEPLVKFKISRNRPK